MSFVWSLDTLIIARNAAIVLGVLLTVLGLLGRVDLSHPRCRRCKADLRPITWTWASDAALNDRRPATCPNCGRVLTGWAVRWRPFPIAWRPVITGTLLIVGSIALYAWTLARNHAGLTWRDVLPVSWDLRAIERLGYPDPMLPPNMPIWNGDTWNEGPWQSLNRRAAAGTLSIAELAAAARVIGRRMSDGDPTEGVAPQPFVRVAHSPAPHADLLIEILHSDLDPALRSMAAGVLVSTPTLTVIGAGGGTVTSGTAATLQLVSAGTRQLWGDHSPLLYGRWTSQAREHRLDLLCHVQEVRLNGAVIPFNAARPFFRSGTVGSYRLRDRDQIEQMPSVSCVIDAPAGTHELAIVIDMAVVDAALAEALIASHGEPGPPEGWGARTIVRRQTVRQTIVVAEPVRGSSTDAGGAP